MDDLSDEKPEMKSKKDERFTFILLIASVLLLALVVQIVDFNKTEGSASLSLISAKEEGNRLVSSIPSDLTFFFFKKLPINTADKQSLMTIKGVGPKLAESILQSRLKYGPFKGSDDLQRISGVGPKRAEYYDTIFDFAVKNEL